MNFVFDLDGTICFDNNIIEEEIVASIKHLEKLGHNVIFASARSYRDCLPVIKDFVNNMIVGLNGGVCYKNNKLLFKRTIKNETTKKILNLLRYYDLPYFLDDHINYYSYKEQEISFIKYVDPLNIARKLARNEIYNIIKIVIILKDKEKLVGEILEKLSKLEGVDVFYHENERMIYINPLSTNKGTTLKKVLASSYICFGNDKNDIDMFKTASYSVQVGNYKPLEKYANKIILESEVASEIKSLGNNKIILTKCYVGK